MKQIMLKLIASAAAVCLTATTACISVSADSNWVEKVNTDIENTVLDRKNAYSNYIEKYSDSTSVDETVTIPADGFSEQADGSDIRIVDTFEEKSAVAVWGNSPDWAQWTFSVPADGLYRMVLVYYPLKQSLRSIETAVKIDGEFPFCEAASVSLKSAYKSEYPIRQDALGNDYNSSQVEIIRWYDEALSGEAGVQDNPYYFWLDAGQHTVTLYLMQETFALAEIRFEGVSDKISYGEYIKKYPDTAGKSGFSKMLQAEEYTQKSDSSLMPHADRNSTKNVPFDYAKLKLNIISGENWAKAGQWLEWNIDIPQSGWYEISFRYSQSYNKNLPANRRLYIDGKVPFAEADCFKLGYEENWEISSLCDGDGNVMRIWFDKGEHTVRLEAVLGEVQEIISKIDDVVYELNIIYQRINMITGATPDQYRDYNLQDSVPDMIETFERNSAILKELRKKLKTISGGKGTTAGIMDVLAYQLDDMAKAPSSVPTRLSSFNSNISSLSSVAEEIKSQAMDLDYILVSAPDTKKPAADDNFFKSILREAIVFAYSFVTDYNTFAIEGDNETITVWTNSGRDQAQVLNRMTNDMFVPEHGISVKLQLVNASLIQAFLSGSPPDVMVMAARGQPVNLAIRGALADLSKMSDFDSVKEEFQNDALTPYCFNDGCYGLPDSQGFFMMFYRKDILDNLDIPVPQTWDELFEVMQILHVNNLDIGLPYAGIGAAGAVDNGLTATSIFSALLLQNGGSFYNESGSKTALTTPEATKAFIQWTDFYTEYGLEMTYSFLNRFRTGTMPIGIAAYTMYNQIYVTAPEIRNLWGMTLIPGTRRSDGTIDRSQGGSGTACVMTSTSEHKAAAWEFMRWWTGADAQTRYANDIESVLGISARHSTANVNAFANIQWGRSEYEVLASQWKEVREIPEVAGSYYTVRGIDNAFRSVVLNGKNPKETLVQYSRDIDAEIKRKRGEFALDEQ